jgi:hypothetical protein
VFIVVDVEHTHVRFLGNLVLNLWDCGGQRRFYESYFDSQRDTIFRSVYDSSAVSLLVVMMSVSLQECGGAYICL